VDLGWCVQSNLRQTCALSGGAGHVGLPLSIVFAAKKQRVLIYDLDQSSLDVIRSGRMPFTEHGAEPLLKKALSKGYLTFTSRPEHVAAAKTIVITIGTSMDEFLTPSLRVITQCFVDLVGLLGMAFQACIEI